MERRNKKDFIMSRSTVVELCLDFQPAPFNSHTHESLYFHNCITLPTMGVFW